MPIQIDTVVKQIESAHKILLTTHKQCDGDGLGCCMATYHALKKIGKTVEIIVVDDIPEKYHFLNTHHVEVFKKPHKPIGEFDLVLIFDTNDSKLVEPLFEELEKKAKNIVFIDHHPPLSYGVLHPHSFIDTEATSTGEIVFFLLNRMKIRMDRDIARAIYTSIVFDSLMFKNLKNPSKTHSICSELLKYETQPKDIHANLFGFQSFNKINFLSHALSTVELHFNKKLALFSISIETLKHYGLGYNEVYDMLELLMNVNEIQCVVMIREESSNSYKISLRSKNDLEILSIAEYFKGGHFFAAGATVHGDEKTIRDQILNLLKPRLKNGGPSSETKDLNELKLQKKKAK